MAEKKPLDLEMGLEASTELRKQATRRKAVAKILKALADKIASNDIDRPDNLRDVVERKHVQLAAQRFFTSDLGWLSALDPGSGVFLSYSTKDEDFARELATDLGNQGIACFLAPLSIKPGASWPDEIWQAIRRCRILVLVATADALKSKWCLLEIGAALGLNKPIVAVLRHTGKLPDVLKSVQAIKVQTKNQQTELIERLKQLCTS